MYPYTSYTMSYNNNLEAELSVTSDNYLCSIADNSAMESVHMWIIIYPKLSLGDTKVTLSIGFRDCITYNGISKIIDWLSCPKNRNTPILFTDDNSNFEFSITDITDYSDKEIAIHIVTEYDNGDTRIIDIKLYHEEVLGLIDFLSSVLIGYYSD